MVVLSQMRSACSPAQAHLSWLLRCATIAATFDTCPEGSSLAVAPVWGAAPRYVGHLPCPNAPWYRMRQRDCSAMEQGALGGGAGATGMTIELVRRLLKRGTWDLPSATHPEGGAFRGGMLAEMAGCCVGGGVLHWRSWCERHVGEVWPTARMGWRGAGPRYSRRYDAGRRRDL
jgi:hypothetical protein